MREMAASLYAVMDKYLYWFNIPKITVRDVIEIIIIAFVIYEIMAWIKNTRAWNLLKGIIVILVFLAVAAIFQLNIILWLVARLASIAVIALVIIFQPELRNALESLGRRNILNQIFGFDSLKGTAARFSEKTISDIVRACAEMSRERTGALIVIERDVQLKEYIRTGIPLDSLISSQLLINIFEHNTPLHDGAIIVRGDRVVAATCYLPLSDNMRLSKDLGTRHRAAVGVSEVSDSLTIVVSEETGAISIAMESTLYHDVDTDFLKSRLRYVGRLAEGEDSLIKRIRKRLAGQSARDASSSDMTGRRVRDAEKAGRTGNE